MSVPDATASAALGEKVVKPVWFGFLDFVGDPVRANTSGRNVVLAGTGQPDLDGEFIGISHRWIDVSPIKVRPGGGDTVTIRVSGLPGIDDADRVLLADPANWQGRRVRLWRAIRNAAKVQQGGIQHYYTGYMVSLLHDGDPSSLTLNIGIESYLAAFADASNRNYLSQEEYDELDLSAKASIAIANGISGNPLVNNTGTPGGRFGSVGGFVGNVARRLINRV